MINGELIVDNFAGGGGASTGIELATGYSVDIAINHDPEAIKMHKANHPNTMHYCENVWAVDPVKACKGHPVGLAWFSPDCKHFSKAKGGKPKDKNIRGLAWVACRWAGLALKEKDITQKELAIKIDVTPQTINDYVVGRREPNMRTKLAIAQALGVGIGYLLGRDSVGADELLLMIDDKENSLSTPIERRLIYHTAKVVLQELILTYKEAQ